MAKQESYQIAQLHGAVLDVLRSLGGSASRSEIYRAVAEHLRVSEADLERLTPKGSNAYDAQVGFTMDDLKRLGLIESSERGVWRLSLEGAETHLDLEGGRGAQRRVRQQMQEAKAALVSHGVGTRENADEGPLPGPEPQTDLLATLRGLSASGFERFCRRLLLEAGFVEVKVTGQAGDGGIDGHGILQLNELVSFRVVFQCKRYQGSVGPSMVRDFRGGVETGIDKALLITTGTFTKSAEDEASKAGLLPVELVDGERLLGLLERLKLGVVPRTVYDVDERFFDEYR